MSVNVDVKNLRIGDIITVTGCLVGLNNDAIYYDPVRLTLKEPKEIVLVRKGFRNGDKIVCYCSETNRASKTGGVVAVYNNTNNHQIYACLLNAEQEFQWFNEAFVEFATPDEISVAENALAEAKKEIKKKEIIAAVVVMSQSDQCEVLKAVVASMADVKSEK